MPSQSLERHRRTWRQCRLGRFPVRQYHETSHQEHHTLLTGSMGSEWCLSSTWSSGVLWILLHHLDRLPLRRILHTSHPSPPSLSSTVPINLLCALHMGSVRLAVGSDGSWTDREATCSHGQGGFDFTTCLSSRSWSLVPRFVAINGADACQLSRSLYPTPVRHTCRSHRRRRVRI